MEGFDNAVKKYTSWLDNPYVSGALTVFLIVYASMAAPKLPGYIARLFDYTVFKLFIFFLIVYVSKRNATVALVAAVALMVSIMTLDRLKFGQEMMEVVKNDERSRRKVKMGGCVCECDDVSDMSDERRPVVRTEEGHLVLHEAKKLEAENALHPAHVQAIAREIANAEKQGVPVLAARTDEGAKHMREIAKAENSGLVTENEAKKMVAKVVVHEIVSGSTNVGQEQHDQNDMLAHSDLQLDIHAPANQDHHMINPEVVRAESRMIRPREEHELVHAESRMEREESRMIPHPHEEDSGSSKTTSMAELAHEVIKRKQEETARRGGVEPSSEELRRICAGVLNDYRKSSSCGANCARGGSSSISGNDELASSYASADHR